MPEAELEKEIAAWRARMSAALPGRPATVQELEEHLRDQVDALMKDGALPSVAFDLAASRLGDVRAIAGELQRMSARWPVPLESRGARLLAHMAVGFGVLMVVQYLAMSFWILAGRFKVLGVSSAGFSLALILGLIVVSGLAVQTSRRFLRRPNLRDARSVAAFNLFVVWLVTANLTWSTGFSYWTRLALVAALGGGVAILWLAAIDRKHAPAGLGADAS